MQSTTASRVPGGIPGRYFAVVFGTLLGVLLIIGIPVVLRFGSNQDRLEDLRRAWPAAASKVDKFYSAVDLEVAKDPSPFDAKWSQAWKASRSSFAKSPNREEQVDSVLELERLTREGKLKLTESVRKTRAELIASSEVKKYLEIEAGLAQAESDWIGRLVSFLLRMRPSIVVGENWRDLP